ncbi:MAG: OmpA family protein [Bacteroidales bacterium]|jgi:peptidoglycan-associated lipoprotein
MRLIKLTFTLLFIIGVTFGLKAQKPSKSALADTAYSLQQYYEAIDLYKAAYDKIKKNKAEKARIKYRISLCYRALEDTKQAEVWFGQVVKMNFDDPLATLYYADALKSNEKYADALVQYTNYKQKAPSDPRGANGITSCELAQKWKQTPTRFVVENMKEFNSKNDDFSPTFTDKKYKTLIFTSTRESSTGNAVDNITGESFSDLYIVTQDKKGKWSSPVPLPEPINSSANEGPTCMNQSMNTLYFTRCGVRKKAIMGCDIYVTSKQGPNWDLPQLVNLNPDTTIPGVTIGHPAITKDELTLYFASNLPGGKGGKDIWIAKRKSKNQPFGKAVNVGVPINTAGDEMFPYVHENGTLYFASNGLVGMGALDIYKSTPKPDGTFTEPENMKYPINTSANDFGIIFEGLSEKKGCLTSNREGGKGLDDIYTFVIPPLLYTLKGVVTEDSTKKVLMGAIVIARGSDGNVYVDTTDATGLYSFNNTQILENTSYNVTCEKVPTHMKFAKSSGQASTVGLQKSTDLKLDLVLQLIPEKPIVLPEIRYAFDKWDLLPQYQDSLNGLEQTMKDNENLVIELSSHTDARGKDAYNDELSLKRAQSVVNYLITKGVAGDRMVAKGYGKRKPRVLDKTIIITDTTGKSYVFKAKTALTEKFIKNLKYKGEQEAAHQLNRRTEFKIIGKNYVAKGGVINAPTIQVVTDSTATESPFNNVVNPQPNQNQQQQTQPNKPNQAPQPNKDATKPK